MVLVPDVKERLPNYRKPSAKTRWLKRLAGYCKIFPEVRIVPRGLQSVKLHMEGPSTYLFGNRAEGAPAVP